MGVVIGILLVISAICYAATFVLIVEKINCLQQEHEELDRKVYFMHKYITELEEKVNGRIDA